MLSALSTKSCATKVDQVRKMIETKQLPLNLTIRRDALATAKASVKQSSRTATSSSASARHGVAATGNACGDDVVKKAAAEPKAAEKANGKTAEKVDERAAEKAAERAAEMAADKALKRKEGKQRRKEKKKQERENEAQEEAEAKTQAETKMESEGIPEKENDGNAQSTRRRRVLSSEGGSERDEGAHKNESKSDGALGGHGRGRGGGGGGGGGVSSSGDGGSDSVGGGRGGRGNRVAAPTVKRAPKKRNGNKDAPPHEKGTGASSLKAAARPANAAEGAKVSPDDADTSVDEGTYADGLRKVEDVDVDGN